MEISHRGTRFQLVAALVIGGLVVAAAVVWKAGGAGGDTDPCQPASQSAADKTGSQLCTGLRKAALPALLGIPTAKPAYGGQMTVPGSSPEVHVEWNVGQYSVILSTGQAALDKPTEQVAGHPAALLSGTSGGKQVNRLEVAWSAAGGTGVYAVDVMMVDGSAMAQSDAGRLERAVAAKVLPGLPEWRAG